MLFSIINRSSSGLQWQFLELFTSSTYPLGGTTAVVMLVVLLLLVLILLLLLSLPMIVVGGTAEVWILVTLLPGDTTLASASEFFLCDGTIL